jgi:hypothetical protein
MPSTPSFEWVSQELERIASLERLEAPAAESPEQVFQRLGGSWDFRRAIRAARPR